MTLSVHRYTAADAGRWDAFVAASKNGTFLLQRSYVDYHADRFPDASLIISDEGTWVAVLPATRSGDVLASHAGLTYGGFVIDASMTTPRMLQVFDATAAHLRAAGVTRVSYKTIPTIYHALPAEEDRYALFRNGARLVRRDVLSCVFPAAGGPVQSRRRRGAKKAAARGVTVRVSDDLATYWAILSERLGERHGARPVHTLEEMTLLRSRFPEAIRLHAAYLEGVLVAGVVVYETPLVAHAQYIASNDLGRETGALDLLFEHLIGVDYAAKRWFDFGTSTEQGGQLLNVGLIEQKEGFGARAVSHDFYEWELATEA